MKIVKQILKKLGYYLLEKIIVSREAMLSDPRSHVSYLRDEYLFTPQYTPSEYNDLRYPEMPDFITVSPFFKCCIHNVCLIGPYGIPVTRNGRILKETSQASVMKNIRRTVALLGIFEVMKLYLLALMPFKKVDIESGLHLIPRHGYKADSPNYSHWLLENLPQLFALEFIDDKATKIIVNKSLTKWQVESLNSMGQKEEDLFLHSKIITRVRKLYISSMRGANSTKSERDPVGRSWVVEKILGQGKRSPSPIKNRRVFLSRQDMGRGFITNMSEVKSVLDKYQIEIFHPATISFQDDADFFKNVDLTIAPHGAGMANMVFAKKCHVIEIVCGQKWLSDLFYFTALEFNFSYDTALAQRDHDYEVSKGIEEAWIVDIPVLINTIQRSPIFA